MIQEVTKAKTRSDALMEFLVFVLTILISTFLLRVVWNRSLVKHISVLKPINTMLDAFILALSLQIVRGI
jgi:Na+/H+-dicarboxylate symporter